MTNEKEINKFMTVLRKTNQAIGHVMLEDRLKTKKEEKEARKSRNVNFVKQKIINHREESQDSIKKKIRQMRRDKKFPLPKSFTNYNGRKGLLRKNSIKIEPFVLVVASASERQTKKL